MTLEHQEELKGAILTLLGLNHAPRRNVHRVDVDKNYTVEILNSSGNTFFFWNSIIPFITREKYL